MSWSESSPIIAAIAREQALAVLAERKVTLREVVEAGNAMYAVLDAVASEKGERYTYDEVAAVMEAWLNVTLDRPR